MTIKKIKQKLVLFGLGTASLLGTVGANSEADLHYVHNDHLGTTQVLTDKDQNVVWKGNYDPFGNVDIVVEQVEMNLRLPGQYYDKETGYLYNYFRDYDATLGRYLQSDPIGLNGGLNTYGYVGANPINYTDPFGLVRWKGRAEHIGGGALGMSAGKTQYVLKSECINGKQFVVTVIVDWFGFGAGSPIGVSASRVEVNDSNTVADPTIFAGSSHSTSATLATPIGGVAVSASRIGNANSSFSPALAIGFDVSVASLGGVSRVVSSKEISCECEK